MILRTGPRVRWPIQVKEDQSLLGIMVETAAENLHPDIGSILSFAELSSSNGIGLAMRDADARAKLAYALDQPLEVVDARAHKLAAPIRGMEALDFFGARVPAFDIIYDRRRVGRTDISNFHHRATWQLLGLPFCPETGAGVTDKCCSCGTQLGWRFAADAARCYAGSNRRDVAEYGGGQGCDACGARDGGANDKPPVVDSAVLSEIAPLTRLLDPRPHIHDPARQALPAELRSEDRGIVFYLAVRLGRALTLNGQGTRLRKGAVPPLEEVVSSLQAGVTVLAEWPNGLGRLISKKAGECHDEAMSAVRAVRRVCYGEAAWPEHRRLIEAAMPTISGGRDQKVLGVTSGNTVDGRSAAAIIGIPRKRMQELIRPDVLMPVIRRGSEKLHGSFAVADLEPISAALKESMAAAQAVEQWGITLHGVEQLICMGELDRADHPAILALHPTLRIKQASFLRLTSEIEEGVAKGKRTTAYMPLRHAVLRVGGREKPWGAIFTALAKRRLRYKLRTSPGRLVDRLMVEDGPMLDVVLSKTFDRAAHEDFPFAPVMRQRDAIELLNIFPKRFQEIAPFLGDDAHGEHKTLRVDALLVIAARIIDRREAKARWGVHLPPEGMMDGGLGWRRSDVEGTHSR
ncbi:MAG: hypothetical protein K2Y17_10090 [Qipengyuania sp.]|nr:hypothetical protein [Qipengyuania sp.]